MLLRSKGPRNRSSSISRLSRLFSSSMFYRALGRSLTKSGQDRSPNKYRLGNFPIVFPTGYTFFSPTTRGPVPILLTILHLSFPLEIKSFPSTSFALYPRTYAYPKESVSFSFNLFSCADATARTRYRDNFPSNLFAYERHVAASRNGNA